MSFLRSVITDARPRKPMPDPSNVSSAIPGWKTRGLDGETFGAEESSPDAQDQTSRLSTSLPIREDASDFNRVDTPAFHAENQDNQDLGSNIELENTQNRTSVHEETESVSSPVIVRDTVGRESTNQEDSSAPRTEGDYEQLAGYETMSFSAKGKSPVQVEVAGETAVDDRGLSESTIKGPETTTIQSDATQTTTLASPKSNHRIGASVLDPSVLSYDASGTQTLGTAVTTTVSHGTRADGDLYHSGEVRVDDSSGPVSMQVPIRNISAEQNEAEKAITESGKARQISPGTYKQADIKSLTHQEDISRFQKLSETTGAPLDVQLVSQQAITMSPQGLLDMEHTLVPKSAEKKVLTTASFPGSGSSKTGDSVQHITRPTRSSSPEVLRSVPATQIKTDSISKVDDTFRSNPLPRSPEKMDEAPKVQIGQIDVIIEAATQPMAKPATAMSPNDLASRNYLRRL